MAEDEIWFGFVMGLILAVVVAIIGSQFVENDPDAYRKCKTVCESNDGVKASFVDGDCACNNGARFSWDQIK